MAKAKDDGGKAEAQTKAEEMAAWSKRADDRIREDLAALADQKRRQDGSATTAGCDEMAGGAMSALKLPRAPALVRVGDNVLLFVNGNQPMMAHLEVGLMDVHRCCAAMVVDANPDGSVVNLLAYGPTGHTAAYTQVMFCGALDPSPDPGIPYATWRL
jgi:hypothetical protein